MTPEEITRAELIEELDRELTRSHSVYTQRVRKGTLSQKTADYRVRVQRTARDFIDQNMPDGASVPLSPDHIEE